MSSQAMTRANASDRILIAGTARSGTTWATRVLSRAEGATMMNEPDNVLADTVNHPSFVGTGFRSYPILAPGDRSPHYEALWEMAFAGRVPMRRGPLPRVARVVLHTPRRVRDPMLSAVAKVMARTPGTAKHVVVKSVMPHFDLEWLAERFHPQIVMMQRNPLNVISSWVKLKVHGYDLHYRDDIRERFVEPLGVEPPPASGSQLALTAGWVGLLTTVLADVRRRHPDWILVTHEDLCDDAITQFKALFNQLGLTWTEEAEKFLTEKGYNHPTFRRTDWTGEHLDPAAVTKAQARRWEGRLSEREVDEIMTVLNAFPGRGWVQAPASFDEWAQRGRDVSGARQR